jgi:hypothetical protein
MEAGLAHPIFDAVRPWAEKLRDFSLEELNRLAGERGLRTENGKAITFLEPKPSDPYYEIHLFETGEVHTRPGNKHDLFNALAWLAFPRTKARINALHAREIPREGGRRGRLRDLLTIFDEGGAVVVGNGEVEELIRRAAWEKLFMEKHRELRIVVLGHAVLEQALAPYPGLTCKVIFADPSQDLDAHCAEWLARHGTSPRDLPPLPVMGYPGWYPGNGDPAFLADARYFRGKPGSGPPGRRTPLPDGARGPARESARPAGRARRP